MVEEPQTLTGREPPGPPKRRRPSRTRIIVRRSIGLVLVLGLLAVLGGSAWALIGGGSEEAAPPPPAPPPPPKTCNIAFPEGFTRAQMAQKIAANARAARRECGFAPRLRPARYLDLTGASANAPRRFAVDGKPPFLEGFLFPATYEYTTRTTTRQLVNTQLASFQHNWAKINMRYARSKNLTPYDVLIIASMVEKEVVAPEERRLVAAVIYNRLKARMTLGIDATIRYALRIPPTESLRESHLHDPTPYNTRIHPGLPPTPIANPGLASLRAAAHPAKVKYLYYVRKPDKVHHFFTASERDFINYKNAHGY
jgi:peptidoglycan lytic transglycosylase G